MKKGRCASKQRDSTRVASEELLTGGAQWHSRCVWLPWEGPRGPSCALAIRGVTRLLINKMSWLPMEIRGFENSEQGSAHV
jgi:hypothetical protein